MKKKLFIIFIVLLSSICLPAQIFRPLEQMSDVERSVFLAEHYWDGFPFSDTMIIHQVDRYNSRIAAGAISGYFNAIQMADLPTIQKSLVATIKKADTNEVMYRYFVELFSFFLHDALSSMREERWIEPVWQQMLKSKWCTFSDSANINFLLRMAAKNRVGSIATDLDFVDINNNTGKLLAIDAELLLVYFYIPGCDQCIKTRERIEQDTSYQKLIKSGTLKVLAFYPEKDMGKFITYSSTIPKTWINAHDPQGRSQLEEEEKYQMRGAPTMYLLDSNKRIILKDAREDLLFEEFRNFVF